MEIVLRQKKNFFMIGILVVLLTAAFTFKLLRQNTINNFSSLPYSQQETSIQLLIQKKGVLHAWGFLVASYKGTHDINSNAHLLSHIIGNSIFKTYGVEGFRYCSGAFAYGCIHGFFESAFFNDRNNLAKLSDVCLKIQTSGDEEYDNCLHGIGHGVALTYMSKDLTSVLKRCDIIPKDREYCYDGVFMEYQEIAPDNFYHVTDMFYPCTVLTGLYQKVCARSQPFVMQSRFHLDFSTIATLCSKNSVVTLRNECADVLGMAFGERSLGQTKKILTDCQVFSENTLYRQCISSAAAEIIYQHFPGAMTNASVLCSSLLKPEREECNTRIKRANSIYNS